MRAFSWIRQCIARELPYTSFTNPNFMRIRTLARAPRTVQLGARFVF